MTDIDSDGLLACAADDSATARHLLEEAAERLDEHSGAMSVAEYAQASASVATGYAQLAALGLNMATAEGAAKQNARILEMQSVVADAHRAMESRQRAEQAEIEARTAKLAELDVATLAASGQRQARAEAEARPHAAEPCPEGECSRGMCSGLEPCGGCCGCKGGCLNFRPVVSRG